MVCFVLIFRNKYYESYFNFYFEKFLFILLLTLNQKEYRDDLFPCPPNYDTAESLISVNLGTGTLSVQKQDVQQKMNKIAHK